MKKKVIGISAFAISSLLYACGGGGDVNSSNTSSSAGSSSVVASSVVASSVVASSGAVSSSAGTGSSSSIAVAAAFGPGQKLIAAAGKSFQMGADSTYLVGISTAAVSPNADDYIWRILQDGVPEYAVHTVSFAGSFLMDSTEVTQAQFSSTMNAAGLTASLALINTAWTASQSTANMPIGDNYPANVSRPYIIAQYANARSTLEGLTPAYTIDTTALTFTTNYAATGYRMPTEAEWEYAARGGVAADFSWNKALTLPLSATDSSLVSDNAVWIANSGSITSGAVGYGPHEVASKAPNAYGLYDMAGNMSELVNETFAWATYASGAVTDPRDSGVLTDDMNTMFKRGGNWMSPAMMLRSSCRSYFYSAYQEYGVGFRLVRKAP